jgi:uncharacterized protein (TIGR00369 family)
MTDANDQLYQRWIDDSPFASWLDFQTLSTPDGLRAVLPFQEKNVGNPFIRSLHGGIVSASMECSGGLLAAHLHKLDRIQKPASISISYIRSTVADDLNIFVSSIKTGARLTFLNAQAWQDDKNKLVAVATMTFLRNLEET